MTAETERIASSDIKIANRGRPFRFGLRALFVLVAALALILWVARENRGVNSAMYGPIAEQSTFQPHRFYVDAANELKNWLTEQGFRSVARPAHSCLNAPGGQWFEKNVTGVPINVCVSAWNEGFYVSVEYYMNEWPFQLGSSDSANHAASQLSGQIDKWWSEYKNQFGPIKLSR